MDILLEIAAFVAAWVAGLWLNERTRQAVRGYKPQRRHAKRKNTTKANNSRKNR